MGCRGHPQEDIRTLGSRIFPFLSPQSGVSVDGAFVTPDTAPVHVCSRCRTPMPLDAFRRDSRGYVRSHCIPCALAVTQEWRARHHAQLLDRRRVQRAAHEANR